MKTDMPHTLGVHLDEIASNKAARYFAQNASLKAINNSLEEQEVARQMQ